MKEIEFFNELMTRALEAAEKFRGATSPNPPVGAISLDENGEILKIGAHTFASGPHAEVLALDGLQNVHTLIVTLEPCHHFGKTPPCTDTILKSNLKRVVFGTRDPNDKVKGGGSKFLKSRGIEVIEGVLEKKCLELIGPFQKWIKTGLPWITIKTAWNLKGSMIPPLGKKTFTSPESLQKAHALRKRADAILTGSGTVLADLPEFTVRLISDHPSKKRWLVVLDRRKRVPQEWAQSQESKGFLVKTDLSIENVFSFLGSKGCLEVLVEAGPTLTKVLIDQGLWDEHYKFLQSKENEPDQIVVLKNLK